MLQISLCNVISNYNSGKMGNSELAKVYSKRGDYFMKKLLALVLTFLMSANLVLSVYAGDDVGGSTQIDY